MARHPRQCADSGIYHVMLRGVNCDAIFIEDADYERILLALAQTKVASGCSVLAYCLMPNHVHLVLRTADEPIGAVVKRLGVRYAGWFNHKYGRVGHLFQDRFLSRPVDTDEYLVALLRYVWDNPVKAGLVVRPEDYRWGSRRLLGSGPGLVDDDLLRRLAPGGTLASLLSTVVTPLDDAATAGRRPRHTDDRAVELLRNACGAASPREFAALDPSRQHRAIAELRTRAVSYRQLEKITGVSRSRLQRLHAARTLA